MTDNVVTNFLGFRTNCVQIDDMSIEHVDEPKDVK